MTEDSSLCSQGDPYVLVRSYMQQAEIVSKAYEYSEAYYRSLNKTFSYPLVVVSAAMTVVSGAKFNQYALLVMTFINLILVGLSKVIDPRDKEFKASQIKTEMGEIASNAKQFLNANNRTRQEVKVFSELLHEQINIWKSLCPPINDRFLQRAKSQCAKRTRSTNQ